MICTDTFFIKMDWTRFYSELNRVADTNAQWPVTDMLRVLGRASALNDTDNVAASVEIVTYDIMLDEADKDTDIRDAQWNAFEFFGDKAGVGMDLAAP